MCTTNSVISPTLTAARALCGSSAISWIELVRSTLLALASSADFLPSYHSAIRDPIAYPALRFRASTLLSRKNVSPYVNSCRNHVRKWTRLSLAFRSGGSKVIRRLLRGRREKPGDEANCTHSYAKIWNAATTEVHIWFMLVVGHSFRPSAFTCLVHVSDLETRLPSCTPGLYIVLV